MSDSTKADAITVEDAIRKLVDYQNRAFKCISALQERVAILEEKMAKREE